MDVTIPYDDREVVQALDRLIRTGRDMRPVMWTGRSRAPEARRNRRRHRSRRPRTAISDYEARTSAVARDGIERRDCVRR